MNKLFIEVIRKISQVKTWDDIVAEVLAEEQINMGDMKAGK